MSFHEFTRRNKCTYDEADKLAWHLVQMRARRAYEHLRPQPRYKREAIAP